MKNYIKPEFLANEELSEGVYAASGNAGEGGGGNQGGSDCWTVSAYIDQKPETGRNNYVIKTDGTHYNLDHHRSHIVITYHFNQTVTFESVGRGNLVGSPTGTSISIEIDITTYNSNEGLGAAALYVQSASGLVLSGVSWVCKGLNG